MIRLNDEFCRTARVEQVSFNFFDAAAPELRVG
jgi:hypothetical protein